MTTAETNQPTPVILDDEALAEISSRKTFEQVRDACALLARTTVFAQMTLRKKIDPEVATAVSTEIYMELKSMTVEQIKK